MNNPDFLIAGAGIIGLSVARTLKREYPDAQVLVLEKESSAGLHASGRNSGVLHAGFYYTADSLKAKFTRDGNRELTAYCESRDLALRKCGKLVVASNQSEDKLIDLLKERGDANGVPLEIVDKRQAKEIEPRAITFDRALFSPTTSSANPKDVTAAVLQDALDEGIDVRFASGYRSLDDNEILTTNGDRFSVGHFVNAAGLYADKVAKDFGFGRSYSIVPFKGLYLKSDEAPGAYRTHIYPVPDLKYPFLGVHFTIQQDGTTKIGPTAIPAFWREQYNGLSGFKVSELTSVMRRLTAMFVRSDADFRHLTVNELRKYSRRRMVNLAARLATGIRPEHFRKWGKPGIRAQLLNHRNMKLEMDFVVEGDARSTHVLNAVSPGWTCAFPFARHVVEVIKGNMQK